MRHITDDDELYIFTRENQISLYPEFLAFFHFWFQRKEKREPERCVCLRGTDDSFFAK